MPQALGDMPLASDGFMLLRGPVRGGLAAATAGGRVLLLDPRAKWQAGASTLAHVGGLSCMEVSGQGEQGKGGGGAGVFCGVFRVGRAGGCNDDVLYGGERTGRAREGGGTSGVVCRVFRVGMCLLGGGSAMMDASGRQGIYPCTCCTGCKENNSNPLAWP